MAHLQPQRPKSAFRDRLVTYLVGLMIGCFLTGWLIMRRQMAAQQAQQARQVTPGAENAQTPETPEHPATPAADPSAGGAGASDATRD